MNLISLVNVLLLVVFIYVFNWDAQHVIKVKQSLQIITTVNSVPAHIVSNILDKRSLRNSK